MKDDKTDFQKDREGLVKDIDEFKEAVIKLFRIDQFAEWLNNKLKKFFK